MSLGRGRLIAGTVVVTISGLLAGVGLASVPAEFAAGISPGARFIVGAVIGLVAALGGLYGAFSWAGRRRVVEIRAQLLARRYARAMQPRASVSVVMERRMFDKRMVFELSDGSSVKVAPDTPERLSRAANRAVAECNIEIFRREFNAIFWGSENAQADLLMIRIWPQSKAVFVCMMMLQVRVPVPRLSFSRRYKPVFEAQRNTDIENLRGVFLSVDGDVDDACALLREYYASDDVAHEVFQYQVHQFDDGLWLGEAEDIAGRVPVGSFERHRLEVDGQLYIGSTSKMSAVQMAIETMPHMLIAGQSGFGKSVFINQLLYGVLHNRRYFERICLIDLKGGVEFVEYMGLEQVQVVWDMAGVRELMAEVGKLLDDRLTAMREARKRTWPGPRLLVMVDEYAQLADFEPEDREDKQAHARMMTGFRRLAMQGRAAGISLVCCTQKATTDAMDSAVRGNLQVSVLFRPPNRQFGASVMGSRDDLDVDPMELERGEFLYWNPYEGEPRVLRSHKVPEGLIDEVFRG